MTQSELLEAVASGKVKPGEAAALLAAMTPKGNGGTVYFHVSEKGGISAYGLQRMPVTLYLGQWERVIGQKGDCKTEFAQKFWEFVEKHNGKKYHRTRSDGTSYVSEISHGKSA